MELGVFEKVFKDKFFEIIFACCLEETDDLVIYADYAF